MKNISFSRILTLSQCEMNYKYTYIDGNYGGANIYTEVGTLLHSCIEDYLTYKLDKKDVMTKFLNSYNDIVTKFSYNKNEEKNKKSIDTHKMYYGDYLLNLSRLKNIDNLEIEKKVHLPLNLYSKHEKLVDTNFMGYVDFIYKKDNETIVIDFKTSTEYTGDKKKIHSYQLILYGIALEHLGYKNIKLYWDFLKYRKVENKKSLELRANLIPNSTKGLREIEYNEDTKKEALFWLFKGIERLLYLEENQDKCDSIFTPTNFFCNNLCPHIERCREEYGVM